MIYSYKGKKPQIAEDCFIAPSADVCGNVTLAKGASVWFGAVARGDSNTITIGENSNIQDLVTLHCSHDAPLTIGKGVSVGHNAVVHGATVGDNVLIGMGAIVLDGAVIGDDCLIGAGSLVAENKEIPPGSLVVGVPGKVKRSLTAEEIQSLRDNAAHYVDLAAEYRQNEL